VTTDQLASPVGIEEIEAAARRVAPHVARTPVLDASELGAGPLWVKAESLQKTGSFKVRGAFNAVIQLTPEQRARGVITLSAGNHGMALALAAASHRLRCVVVLPQDAPAIKAQAIARLGAELLPVPRGDLSARLEEERERQGLTLVHPFDDPAVVAGQGSVGLEIIEAVPDVGTIVVPVGGGGLVAGIAAAAKARRPSVRLVGVEPEICAAVSDSLRAGRPVPPQRLDTVADGLAAPYTRPLNLGIIQRLVDEMVQVSESQIVDAVRAVARDLRLVAEPAGATAVAALREGRVSAGQGPTVAVLTGSNVDPARLAGWLA
jgi:threonine dehydratase